MKTLILMILSVGLLTSSAPPNEEFEFSVSFKNNRVVFNFEKGATYQMMFNANRKVVLNENGMVNMKNRNEIENSDFLIEYSKKGNLVTLKGIKGVNWEDLTIMKSRDVYCIINENGIRK